MQRHQARSVRSPFPQRVSRKDAFLGIHFDFHASDDSTAVGRGLDRASVERVIELVRPDYIQCDCKGHRGLSSYPTRVGHRAPGFVRDPLRIWREVTARRGVSLIMHYSGVWDAEAVKRHPEWARVDEKGKRDAKMTSVFGGYLEGLLLPQLLELHREYGVDGAWIDGDCWAACRDYSRAALAAFRKETGIRSVPRRPEDKYYHEFSQFCREGFRRYLARCQEALRRQAPEMQVTSNWAFSSHMPEPVSVDLPFLSGDYSLSDSVNTARWEARCLAQQGKPWDLMAWGFSGLWEDPCRSSKSAQQLQREAATVLALGGGFQVYYKQDRNGAIEGWPMPVMGEVATFCRRRQRLCHRGKSVPQIGLHYASSSCYRHAPGLFASAESLLAPTRGVLQCLLDGQAVVDVVMDHHLREGMEQYPLLVLPEWPDIAEDLRQRYVQYVRHGGSLLVIGARAVEIFPDELGVAWDGEIEQKPRWIEHEGWLSGVLSAGRKVRLRRGARGFGLLRLGNDSRGPSSPAASIRRLGQGLIAGVYVDMGDRYCKQATSGARNFLKALCHELFPHPMASVTGSSYVDVAVTRNRGQLMVHLINLSGPHANTRVQVFDAVEPVGPLQVSLRLPKRPARITRHPGGEVLSFRWRKGAAELTLPQVHIHDILAIS